VTQTQAGAAPPAEEFDPTKVQSAWMRAGITEVYNTVVVMMRKGGAGKTTLTLLLADALARFGLNVLIAEVDPQGDVSTALGNEVELEQVGTTRIGGAPRYEPTVNTMVEVMESGEPGVIEEAILQVDWGYDPDAPFLRGGPLFSGQVGVIGLVPAYEQLETVAETWTPADFDKLAITLLRPTPDGDGVPPNMRWDVVLFDTPHGAAGFSYLAGKAAEYALLVTQPEKFGAKALPKTVAMVKYLREQHKHDRIKVLGLVLNEFVERSSTHQQVTDDITLAHEQEVENFEIPIWPVRIPDRTVVGKSQDAEAPLSAFLGPGTPRSDRDAAVKVAQAGEAAAIMLLEQIGHPDAKKIKAAWAEAWPEEIRTSIVNEVAAA
jgi:cellulose biosynthesis protein BcsQ